LSGNSQVLFKIYSRCGKNFLNALRKIKLLRSFNFIKYFFKCYEDIGSTSLLLLGFLLRRFLIWIFWTRLLCLFWHNIVICIFLWYFKQCSAYKIVDDSKKYLDFFFAKTSMPSIQTLIFVFTSPNDLSSENLFS